MAKVGREICDHYTRPARRSQLLGLADQVGTLSAGKLADIVAVAGDPLLDLKTTEHALFVMKAGTVYVGPPAGR